MNKERSEYLKAWKQKRYNEGICYKCGDKLESKLKLCSECRRKNKEINDAWRDNAIKNRLCTRCGKPITDSNNKTCKSCSEKSVSSTIRQNKIAQSNGICISCRKNPICSSSKIYCQKCRDRKHKINMDNHDKKTFDGNWFAAKERDNYTCQCCNSVDKLEVHHIDSNRSNNDLSNLITLCHNCHVLLTSMLASSNISFLIQLLRY